MLRLLRFYLYGIDSPATVAHLLNYIDSKGWSTENVAFGMGGGLLQKHDRDTYSFVMKMSAIKIGDEWRHVCKNPKDAAWKKSKSGILETYQKSNGEFDYRDLLTEPSNNDSMFVDYIKNGVLSQSYNEESFNMIRRRALMAKKK